LAGVWYVIFSHVLTSIEEHPPFFNFDVMATLTRYVGVYKSKDPAKSGTISFGVRAKKKSQALKKIREYIYAHELHDSKVYDYALDAEPSNKPALHEIPDAEDPVDITEEYYEYD
jgi:hypothetical protein